MSRFLAKEDANEDAKEELLHKSSIKSSELFYIG